MPQDKEKCYSHFTYRVFEQKMLLTCSVKLKTHLSASEPKLNSTSKI